MAALDPNAAADAWLDQLPIAERFAAAACTEDRLVAWWLGWFVLFFIALLVLDSGVLRRLRGLVERHGPRPWLASATLAGAFALMLLAVKAPFDAFVAWRGDVIVHQADGAHAGFAAHLAQAAAGAPPLLGAAIVLVPLLQWLMRRRPRTWPLIAGAGLAAAILGVAWLPYALSLGPPTAPLPPGPARESMLSLIRDAHIPTDQVYQAAAGTLDVNVTGGFGHARVTVDPTAFNAHPQEILALAGHLMGHYAHADILTIYLLFGVLTFLGLLALQYGFQPLARLLGAGELHGPSDPEGLPVAAIIAIVVLAASTLASSGYIRWVNVRADAFSLDHARSPDGLAAGLEREWDHQSVDPSPLAGAIFYTHPPLRSRLVHAMTWKTAHGG